MQEAIIDPRTVDTFIQTIFGSYEKFILDLIRRRQELSEQKSKLSKQLDQITKEENLIKDILTGYHGKKLNNLYYNFDSNSLSEMKPKNFPDRGPKESMPNLLSQYYSLNKSQYGEAVEQEMRKSSSFQSQNQLFDNFSLQTTPKQDYQNNVIKIIQKDYLPGSSKDDILLSIDHESMNKAFKQGLSAQQFTVDFARQNKLQKTLSPQTLRLN